MHNPVTMACIFHYAQVSHCKGAPTRAEQIFMHYLFYAFCSNAFCRSQLYLQLFAKDRGKRENQIHLAGRTPEVALVVIIISNLY